MHHKFCRDRKIFDANKLKVKLFYADGVVSDTENGRNFQGIRLNNSLSKIFAIFDSVYSSNIKTFFLANEQKLMKCILAPINSNFVVYINCLSLGELYNIISWILYRAFWF